MTIFQDLSIARPAVRHLRPTQSVLISHLCQEDQTVLRAEGFMVQPFFHGWVVQQPQLTVGGDVPV